MQSVMSLYNYVSTSLRQRTYKPILYISPTSDLVNIYEEEVWQQILKNSKLWAKGYVTGESAWPFKANIKVASDIPSLSNIVECLLLPDNELSQECAAINITVDDFYKTAIDCLPDAAIAVYDFWFKRSQEYSTKFSSKVTAEVHVGRNDFCSCGSGRKYKKCCLH